MSLKKDYCNHYLLTGCFLVIALVTRGHTKSRLKENTIRAVRGQILSKLGLTAAPEEKDSVRPTFEDLQAYNEIRSRVESEFAGEQWSFGQTGEKYFAERITSLSLVQRTAKTKRYKDQLADIQRLTFDSSELSDNQRIEQAELRIPRGYLSILPRNGAQITACSSEYNNISVRCSRVLDSRVMLPTGDVVLDVTNAFTSFTHAQRVNIKIILKGNETRNYSAKSPKEPYILVWYVTRDLYEMERRSRVRRATLDVEFCKRRPKEKRCCVRWFFVNFQRDLKWNWIHAPRGFYANYCQGNCPFLWGFENQTHHTSIMSILNSNNPNAHSEPCCVARSYRPLVILHYEEGKPKIEKLSNMVVTSCTCV